MNRRRHLTEFDVTTYDGKEVEVKRATREEAEAIDPKDYDHYVAKPFGIFAFRTAAGKWVEFRNGKWPGIGPEGLKIIQAIQLNPGLFVNCSDLVELTGNENFYGSNCVSARVLMLRKAHLETKAKPHFFVTSDSGEMSVCWPKERTWIWIEAIRSKASGQDDDGSNDAASEEDKA